MKQLTSLDGVSENLSSSSNISSSRRGNEIVELAGQIFLFYAGEAKEKRCLLAASASASASAIRARRRAKQIWKLESNFLWLVKLQLCVQQTFYLLPLTSYLFPHLHLNRWFLHCSNAKTMTKIEILYANQIAFGVNQLFSKSHIIAKHHTRSN